MERTKRYGWSIAIGGTFITLGVLGVLNNMDIIDIGPIWSLWPVIFVFIGLGKLTAPESPFDRPDGLFWLILSCYFFVSSFRLWDLHWGNAWPIILIGVGSSMAWKSLIKSSGIPSAKEA